MVSTTRFMDTQINQEQCEGKIEYASNQNNIQSCIVSDPLSSTHKSNFILGSSTGDLTKIVDHDSIYVGIRSKWYKEFLNSGDNIHCYIIKTINRIIEYHDKYLNVMKNNGTRIPDIFTAELVCDCSHDHSLVSPLCHKYIIMDILKEMSAIEGLHSASILKWSSTKRKKYIADMIYIGKKKDDAFVVSGSMIGHKYKIIKCLTRGSNAYIFIGIDTTRGIDKTSNNVIIKISRCDEESISILKTEHYCLTKLNKRKETGDVIVHDDDVFFPKVLGMFSMVSHLWGTVKKHKVLILERYGKDLYEYVLANNLRTQNNPTSLKLVHIQTIFRQLAKTIKVVHDADMIHKDIKCENILLRRISHDMSQKNFDIVLIDYGLAIDIESCKRSPDISNNDAKFTHLCGTVAYMSPEEIQGKPYNKSVDIFNIGLIIVEMHRGRYVFPNYAPQVLNAYRRIYSNFPDTYNPRLITQREYDKVINNNPKNKHDSVESDTCGLLYSKNYFTHGITDPDLINLLNSCL